MTVLAERTATTDPVAELHACLDRLTDPDHLGCAAKSAALQSVARAEAKLAAYRLRVLASADRDRAAEQTGMASTSQWAARAVNSDAVVAARQVHLAQRLEVCPVTRGALSAGELSAEHAAVIVRADEQLPAGTGATERAVVETALVAKAKVMPPELLRRAARRALAEVESDRRVVDAHENALVADEEAQARARTQLTLHNNEDGTVTGHFTVPTFYGQLLRKVLDTMTAPRRGRIGAPTPQVGDNTGLGTDWARARGEAFCELLEHLPTDHLHSRSAATLVVTIAEETLRNALAVAQLDTGASLSAGEARRLACTSGLLPAVLGGQSQALDLGRASRLFNETQRTALGLQHQTCAADGCERPFAWCELHHLLEWGRGGPTDLANAIPLCHFHHQRIHDPQYGHEQKPGGITFSRRK